MTYKSKEKVDATPPEVITPRPVFKVAPPEPEEPVVAEKRKPARMTLFNALNRMAFDPDPDKNYAIYMKKRRGHEGRERTYLVQV